MTAIAGYLLNGLPEANVAPNAKIAMEYLREAAQFFRDEDAQFELAKLYLRGEGIESDVPYAKHWLSVLSQKGHAGAQAFLADLLWRGKYMPADPVRALALISVAVTNAPSYERVWIDDIYQNIYCSSEDPTRRQEAAVLVSWRQKYGRPNRSRDEIGLTPLKVSTVRTCNNGEQVMALVPLASPQETGSVASARDAQPAAMRGSVLGVGLRSDAPATGR